MGGVAGSEEIPEKKSANNTNPRNGAVALLQTRVISPAACQSSEAEVTIQQTAFGFLQSTLSLSATCSPVQNKDSIWFKRKGKDMKLWVETHSLQRVDVGDVGEMEGKGFSCGGAAETRFKLRPGKDTEDFGHRLIFILSILMLLNNPVQKI